jgi:hypothetical protein
VAQEDSDAAPEENAPVALDPVGDPQVGGKVAVEGREGSQQAQEGQAAQPGRPEEAERPQSSQGRTLPPCRRQVAVKERL